MIEFEQHVLDKAMVEIDKKAVKYGLNFTAKDLIPNNISNQRKAVRLSMFFAIGATKSNMTLDPYGEMRLILGGIDRFCRSLSNRERLDISNVQVNNYSRKEYLMIQPYAIKAIEYAPRISNSTKKEWLSTISKITIKGSVGLDIVEVQGTKDLDAIGVFFVSK